MTKLTLASVLHIPVQSFLHIHKANGDGLVLLRISLVVQKESSLPWERLAPSALHSLRLYLLRLLFVIIDWQPYWAVSSSVTGAAHLFIEKVVRDPTASDRSRQDKRTVTATP